ncbi:MAG: hypothetical protein H6867_09935 [Rhodospirillales bacterium]|nr:hypothetical protein [Rhodospirillales bacterium]MCB9995897.1 hypothetical protein [Rhodospirillales bacterium]
MRNRSKWLLPLCACFVLTVLPAYAQDDRIAGSVPVSKPSENKHDRAQYSPALQDDDRMAGGAIRKPAPPAPKTQETPDERDGIAPETAYDPPPKKEYTGKVEYAALESHGVYTKSQEGALGRDLWRGTKRSLLIEQIPVLPAQSPYPTMQQLTKRLLLSSLDAGLIKNDVKPSPGNDLTTLRLEKLLEMGAYPEALALYTKQADLPYHDRFARTGVLAAFYDRQPALACLETKAAEKRFAEILFWQQASQACSYILSKASGGKTVRPDIPESKILQRIVDKDNYRFKARSPEDFAELTPLEAAILAAENRFDLSGLKTGEIKELPPHVLILLREQPSLPDEQKISLVLESVRRGLMSAQELGAFYQDQATSLFGKSTKTSLADYKKIGGWKRLPYLFRGFTSASKDEERVVVIKHALALADHYGPDSLLPFVPEIVKLDPSSFDSKTIRSVFPVLLQSGINIPNNWAESRFKELADGNTANAKTTLQYAAYQAGKSSTEEWEQGIDFEKNSEPFGQDKLLALKIIYEKLDKDLKLHNYDDLSVYEKELSLTSAVDYVMPSISLIDGLESAEYDKRLGEVILLSAIVLHNVPPEKLNGVLLRDVINGLVTVGLTKEARSLAQEVILGLSSE